MTDEAKALALVNEVCLERGEKSRDEVLRGHPYGEALFRAVDLIETQAREIERLREALQDSARALDASNVLIHALSGAPSVMVETFAERTRAALAGDSHED